MRFLILGLSYLPESTPSGPYTADLAEYLQQRGHRVQVITGFPMAPQWKIWAPYKGKRFMWEVINGVPVLRTYLYVPKQPGKSVNRILFDTSFAISSLLGGLTVSRCDLIVVISPPLQLGLMAWLLSFLKGGRFFFHIKDLLPDAAVATGMLKENSQSTRIAYALERFIYQRAKGIGVICDGFARNLMAKGVNAEKVVVLPDYIDLDFMRPLERNNHFRQQHGIKPDDFLVMYSGTVALKQSLHTFVETAAEFRISDTVAFYLVGEGAYLQGLKAKAEELRLPHLHFLPLQPRENLPVQLSAADALVVTQKWAITDVVFPSKLLYYMASGRPILAAVSPDSEAGRFISIHQVGLVVPPEKPKELAQAIRFLQQNRREAERLGRNGRIVVEERFDRRVILKQFAEHLETLANNDR
jgi:colanic acid biosynthesis glycosyl transferase WcaI